MSITTAQPRAKKSVLESLPLVGFIARDISRDINTVFYLLVIFVTLVVLAIMKWGLAALTLTAMALVPLMFILFVCICWPFPSKS